MTDLKTCPTCGAEYDDPKERFCPRDGSVLRAHAAHGDLVGQVIGERYHVLRRLGEGGMGQVYLAEHVKMGRRSAVKVMHPALMHDPDAIGRFNREASNASRINHAHVASIYDFGESPTAGGEPLVYLAMEYVEGEPLTAIIERQGALPPSRVATLVRQVADALAAAHDLGIVHRDLKPDNIMVARARDGGDWVKVVDFGVAKAAVGDGQKVTRTGLVVGTPQYMSPEQLAGDPLDGRSDVYALGLVAFNMLTGTLPFPSETAQESMIMRLTERPRTLGEMRAQVAWPAAVQAVMDRALARDVRARYATAPELARDLAEALAAMPAGDLAEERTVVIDATRIPTTRVRTGVAEAATAPIPVAARPSLEITQFTPVYDPARARRSRRPALAIAAAVIVAVVGAGAVYTRRVPAAAPAPAASDSVERRTDSAAVVPAPGAVAPVAGAAAAQPLTAAPEPEADASLDRELARDWQGFIDGIDASNGTAVLARAERQLGRRLVVGPRRARLVFVKAMALGAIGRQEEGCTTLRELRRMPAFAAMDAGFRQNVDLLLDAQSGSCQ